MLKRVQNVTKTSCSLEINAIAETNFMANPVSAALLSMESKCILLLMKIVTNKNVDLRKEAQLRCSAAIKMHIISVAGVLEYNNEGNVELVFRSDAHNSGRGFHMRFQQLSCTSLSNQPSPKLHRCSQTFMSRDFTIQSPGENEHAIHA